jgi:hypothetical protein
VADEHPAPVDGEDLAPHSDDKMEIEDDKDDVRDDTVVVLNTVFVILCFEMMMIDVVLL